MRSVLELYGAKGCPYTRELRESLLWDADEPLVEYDVEEDEAALARLVALTGQRLVPVVVRDQRVLQIGVGGRGCFVGPSSSAPSP